MLSNRIKDVQMSIIRQIYDSAIPNAINLGLGEIQFKTPNHIRLKAKSCINQGEVFYTPNAGILPLRQKIAEYYNEDKLILFNKEKINLSAQNVCICNGTQEAIFAVLFSLINPDDEIIIADPTFLAYKTISEMLGAQVKTFNINLQDNCSLDWNSFLKAYNSKTKAVFLNNPSNPLGKAFTNDELIKIINFCQEKDLILIVDEVYKDVYLESPLPSAWGYYSKTIIVSGLSKSFCMTGWRLGWIVANDELIKPFTIAHQYISTCASAVSQKAALSAFSNKGDQSVCSLRKKIKANYKIALSYLQQKIPKEDIIMPDSAPYLFVKIHKDDMAFCKSMAQKGVIVIPGSAFGNNSKEYIRISVALPVKKLRIGLKRLLKEL